MKIGSLDNKLPIAPVAGERKTNGTTGSAKNASESSATVAISPEASALALVAGDMASDGSFDAAKVERVAQSIKDGSFKPDPEAIADKLIANAQELLSRTYR